MGTLRITDFYRGLQSLCARHGLALARYPSMDAYIRYVLLSDAIRADALMEEIARMEKTAYDRLARGPGKNPCARNPAGSTWREARGFFADVGRVGGVGGLSPFTRRGEVPFRFR